MPRIGSWGARVFAVTNKKMLTFDNYTRKVSYRTEDVENGNQKPGTARIAPELMTQNMQIRVSRFLGVNVRKEVAAWEKACETGAVYKLILGKRAVGSHKHLVKSIQLSSAHFDKKGEMIDCTLDVAFQEYVQEMERATSGAGDAASDGGGSGGSGGGGATPPASITNDTGGGYTSGNDYLNHLEQMR